MVTAVLPAMVATSGNCKEAQSEATNPTLGNKNGRTHSISADFTPPPCENEEEIGTHIPRSQRFPSRLAGIVGLFTGCGALLSLGFLLRLPELIQRTGLGAPLALTTSFYIVGALAMVLALACSIGLRHLNGEESKGWRLLFSGSTSSRTLCPPSALSSLSSLQESFTLGFRVQSLGMGYLGGFIARSSSVGISLMIPLFVNSYFRSSGRCDEVGRNPQDVKEKCREAYTLAAELTGVSQLVALIFAPVFGYLADKYRRFNMPLVLASLLGASGYITLARLENPEPGGERGSPWIFVIMAFLGVSQIGAIVCSLGLLSHSVLGLEDHGNSMRPGGTEAATTLDSHEASSHCGGAQPPEEVTEACGEETPLLSSTTSSKGHLKGSIAGVYSLAGGAGILILTKVGGIMFDKVSPAAPFYMLAIFNLLIPIAELFLVITHLRKGKLAEL